MKIFFRRIGNYIYDALGLDRMSSAYHVLAKSSIYLMFYFTFESVFMNTLLYRTSGGSMSTVIIYRGIVYIFNAAFFYLGAFVSQRKTPVMSVKLGACAYLLTFVVVFIWIDYVQSLQYFLAALSALAGALYWSGYVNLIPHYTTKFNRDTGVAVMGIIGGIMTLCVPVLSGFLIMFMPEISGYRVMFGVSMLAVLIQLYYMSKFHPVQKKPQNKSQFGLAIRLYIRKLSFRLMLGYEFIRGMRDGTFMFILNMLLFEIITNESLVGINTFFSGFMGIIGSWSYGKLARHNQRARYAFIGVLVPFLISLIFLWQMDVLTVMVFNAVNAFMQLFFLNSYINTTFDVVTQNMLTRKASSAALAIRESVMMFGRVSGLVLTMWLAAYGQHGYIAMILILTFIQFFAVMMMKKTLWCLDRNSRGKNHDPA